MHRNDFIIIAVCLISMLCGCQAKPVAQETIAQNETTTFHTPETTEAAQTNSSTEGVETNNSTEETIFYPYLVRCPIFHSEDYDYSLSNKTIANTLEQKIEYIADASNDVADFSADYTVELQSSNFVSILYKIYLNREDTAHPVDIVFGINVDKTGQTVTLKDVLTIDSVLVENFRTAWQDQSNEALQNYLDQYTDKELLELFEEIDPISSDVGFYMTEENIVILFPVPRAAGSNVFIELPRKAEEVSPTCR